MKQYALSGFDTFVCIADKCTDSCCVGWDVVIDEDSVQKYKQMQTPLGEKICERLKLDDDGDMIFEAVDGRCPFLRMDGLCEIQATCGEEALSVTCRRFPRIVQEYDDFTEYCLSLSCPEASRITLSAEKLIAPTPETADPFLSCLAEVRGRMISIVQDRSIPFGEALCRCLRYAEAVQDELYEGIVHPDLRIPEIPKESTPDLDGFFRFFAALDIMTEDFRRLLSKTKTTPTDNRAVLENIAVYFLYRYVLQAVEDGDVLSKVLLMLSAVTFVSFVEGNVYDVARLYSKEVEHSYENMEILNAAFFEDLTFSAENFYGIWN